MKCRLYDDRAAADQACHDRNFFMRKHGLPELEVHPTRDRNEVWKFCVESHNTDYYINEMGAVEGPNCGPLKVVGGEG